MGNLERARTYEEMRKEAELVSEGWKAVALVSLSFMGLLVFWGLMWTVWAAYVAK